MLQAFISTTSLPNSIGQFNLACRQRPSFPVVPIRSRSEALSRHLQQPTVLMSGSGDIGYLQ